MIERVQRETEHLADRGPVTSAPARTARHRPHGRRLQAKLTVGPALDPAEREADQIADEVMAALRAPDDGDLRRSIAPVGPTRIRRRPALVPLDAEVGPEVGAAGGEISADLSNRIRRASGGTPIEADLRSRMEGAFGADLGGVRIHAASPLPAEVAAEAFTVADRIHFAPGRYQPATTSGQHLLSHELAHVVQQGGAPVAAESRVARSTVIRRRMWTAKEFRAQTDAGLLSTRGKTIKQIEKLIVSYQTLTGGADPKFADFDQALTLLDHLVEDIDLWLDNHETDKSRSARRGQPLKDLRVEVTKERDRLTSQRLKAADVGSVPAVRPNQVNKFKEKMEGDASSIFMRLAPLLSAAVPSPGDSAEISVEVKVPVWAEPPVYVGGRLTITADRVIKRKAAVHPTDPTKNVKAVDTAAMTLEAAFSTGVKIGPVDVGVELGGFLEAQGKSPANTLQLLSWGWYRRLRESAVPSEAVNLMWGGSASGAGKKRAEKWSANVMKENFEGAEIAKNAAIGSIATGDTYVRAGLFGAAKAEAKIAASSGVGVGLEGEARLGGGTHWSKDTIDERGRKGDTKQLGQKFMMLELSVGATGGPFGGSIDASVEFMKDIGGKFHATYVQAWVNGSASLPMNSMFADKLATAAKDFAPRIVAAIKKVVMMATGKDKVGGPELAGEGLIIGEDIIVGCGNLTGMTGAEEVEGITEQATFTEGEEAFVVGGEPGETATFGEEPEPEAFGVEATGDITLSLGVGMQLDHTKKGKEKIIGLNVDAVLSLNKALELSAEFVGVSISRSHRLVRLQYERGRKTMSGKKDRVWID